MFDFSSQLNPSQLEAVQHVNGPSLVIAGAGSGKTRVLTYKIAYLLQQGVMPWNVLALTFTNKAAREMNHRIAEIVGAEATRNLWSGTFHSIFSRILRRECEHLGYKPDFTIYDTSDSRSLIKTLVKEMQLDDKVYKASVVQNRISEAKNLLILPEQYAADASLYKRDSINNIPKVRDIYAAYRKRCHKANAMDFDDLLLNTYLLFRQQPEVCEHYRQRFQYILVDEYQDTNSAQHAIIRQLTRPDSSICVVGDDAQSIYGFRGANIDNILQFTAQYPTAKLIKLERNYRSTQNIVNAANCIIRGNANQIEKTIYSEKEVGEKLRVFETHSDKDEAEKVAGEIRRLVRREGVDYEDIALLYRTNAQSRVFEETFRNHSIPYRIWGGLSFYQRKEIKDVISYLRLLGNPDDEEAFKRVINTPARGIGNTTLSKITMAASEQGVSPWQVLCSPELFGVALGKAALVRLDGFKALIVSGMEMAATESAYEVARHMVKASGIWADISVDHSPENLSRQENVQELLNSIKSYEEDVRETEGREQVPLTEFLSQVSLLTDADERDDGTPKVTLMTVHAAKGLEYDTVFVTGLEEDLFPNAQARVFP
ncbi:MAG: UvrD-helicase domain-containing protein, partial [Bacteroidaceae bacterium]|nr:UvrD-helicase domain-containing protein [Bacteroidaceae bacterium]